MTTQGRRRVYSLDPAPLLMIDGWLAHYLPVWETSLDELAIEVARAQAERMDLRSWSRRQFAAMLRLPVKRHPRHDRSAGFAEPG